MLCFRHLQAPSTLLRIVATCHEMGSSYGLWSCQDAGCSPFCHCRCSQEVHFSLQVLSPDYSKIVFMQVDRHLEFHAKFGTYYKTRVPKVSYCIFALKNFTGSFFFLISLAATCALMLPRQIYSLSAQAPRFGDLISNRADFWNPLKLMPPQLTWETKQLSSFFKGEGRKLEFLLEFIACRFTSTPPSLFRSRVSRVCRFTSTPPPFLIPVVCLEPGASSPRSRCRRWHSNFPSLSEIDIQNFGQKTTYSANVTALLFWSEDAFLP